MSCMMSPDNKTPEAPPIPTASQVDPAAPAFPASPATPAIAFPVAPVREVFRSDPLSPGQPAPARPNHSEAAIKVSGLSKKFGRKQVLTNLEFNIPRGTVAGFLGPNGAGKTTTLRILMGLMPPDIGFTELLGHAMPDGRVQALEQTGSLVERPSFMESLTGYENLWWFGALTAPVTQKRILDVLGRVSLLEAAHQSFGTYSTGMKQRLGVAFAILHHPTLLILDEPSNGMDPQGRVQMRDILREIHREEGTTIFLSSHLLDEVQRLCDYVVILDRGRTVREGFVGEILQSDHEVWEIRLEADKAREALQLLLQLPQVRQGRQAPRGLELYLEPGASVAVNRFLLDKGFPVSAVIPHEVSLEETFLKLTSESGEVPPS